MSQYLLLKNIEVENANAINGMTWGFPAPAHFLGFTHALSRKLQQQLGNAITLQGVAIVCHWHQVHGHKPGGYETTFALTRNPLTKEGKTAPFNEEGRMHMRVSLVMECNFELSDINPDAPKEENLQKLISLVSDLAPSQRLAGGTITSFDKVTWFQTTVGADSERSTRRFMRQLLPGFILQDRTDVLAEHHSNRTAENPEAEMLESFLDFVTLKSQAFPEDTEEQPVAHETKAEWQLLPKPIAKGWFVPLAIGYQGISDLYGPGTVQRSRDNETPFRFVESAYGIGQWLSPHRVKDIDDVLWTYRHKEDRYLCSGKQVDLLPEFAEEPENLINFDL